MRPDENIFAERFDQLLRPEFLRTIFVEKRNPLRANGAVSKVRCANFASARPNKSRST